MSGASLDGAPLGRAARPLFRQPLSARSLFQHGIFLLVLLLVATPLAFLILGSFSTATVPGDFSLADLSFENYRTAWSDPGLVRLFGNTFIYVVGSTLLGTAIAAALAFLAERTDMPG